MKRSNSLLRVETKMLKDSVQNDGEFISGNQNVYNAIMSINDSVEYLIKRLDSFQNILLEPKLTGIAGYPKNFRSASLANKTFIYNHAAEDLKLSIERIKANLVKVGLNDIKKSIDSLLPTNSEMINSKGAERAWPTFFFAKTPKAVLLLTTEKIKNDLLNISKDMLAHLVYLRTQCMPIKNPEMSDTSLFIVKLLNGVEVPIKLDWSTVSSDSLKEVMFDQIAKHKLTGLIRRNGADISSATFNQKPMNPPPPVKDEQMYAFVGGGGYDEMYLGVDNPVDVAYSAPEGYTQEITLSDGEVVNKSGKYFLRFKKEGFTKVDVYAVKGGVRKLLQERTFKVILIPNPDVYLSGYKGGTISKDIVKVANSIELKNEASNLSNTVYNCESFDVTLVPFDNPIGEVRVKGNKGTAFSAESKGILKNVKRGDVIILDNFKIQTVDGIIRRIPTVVYRVI
ncbi:hypothetical protein LK994_13970 [Ferruginibacter lapsinanis]|uniref:GldM family protein n=1 Tax=Ferruginibacter lapsinanis TaxID=563172 RepID=UPI001E4FE24D|nr:GldM family protein [Ferruginibacter lapsinanis]UEG49744.1 hypothetical protein LK994_13970 [Ferruginibacter lapsinanis]